MSRQELAELTYRLPVGSQDPDKLALRRLAVAQLLLWLESLPGESWQERWEASAGESHGRDWVLMPITFAQTSGRARSVSALYQRRTAVIGMSTLLCLGVLRPGYAWLRALHLNDTLAFVRQLNDPDFFTQAVATCRNTGRRERHVLDTLNNLSKIVIHTGRAPRELTAQDLLDYHTAVTAIAAQANAMGLTWRIMAEMKVVPQEELVLRHTRRKGRRSVEELVDSYDLACKPVREVLVRYLNERATAIDHTTLRGLVGYLVGSFWKDLETNHPGIDSLNLSAEVAQAWKQRAARMRKHGQEGRARTDRFTLLFTVRAFYLDLSQWALEDPTWAHWVAPNPIRDEDVRGSMKHQRHRSARMHQRTRTLAPLLPQLVRSVEERLRYRERLTQAAAEVVVGSLFTLDGVVYERIQAASDRHRGGQAGAGHLRVHRQADSAAMDLTAEEDEAFWAWAIVETLRHTGIRQEEMLELTHLALVTHRLPDTGETVPLLQIAPSKQDAERVLLVAPELAHVLARIIHRIRAGGAHVPLVPRYDQYERTEGPPLPHLFQRRTGTELRVMSPTTVVRILNTALEHAGLRGPDGLALRYTPHDFRRIFATEAVSGGLPIHIAAKLLGHRDLATTQKYVAVYQDDVLRHYTAFIARRRAERPSEEYREPTVTEWAEFERHFARRKVELGNCVRPYGTPCRHEHACLRCPMLRPDPAQAHRLVEIIANLHERLREATERGWLGEVDGLRTSLEGARQKLQQMRKIKAQSALIPLDTGRYRANDPGKPP